MAQLHIDPAGRRRRAVSQYYTTEQRLRDMHAETQHQTITQILLFSLCAVATTIVALRALGPQRR